MVEIGAITQAGGRRGQGGQAGRQGQAHPERLRRRPTTNSWGFFCDYFYRWWMQQETFGSTSYDRERRLKSGGYTHHHLARRAGAAGRRQRPSARPRPRPARKPPMVAAVEPGTGRVRALAVNRNFKLDDPKNPKNKISSDPAKSKKKHPGQLPEHGQPAAHRRRRHHRLPGRLDLQDLHHRRGAGEGHPAQLHDQRAAAVQVGVHHRAAAARRPAPARTSTARPTPARRPAASQHVDRLRPVGQHLLRPAPAAVGAENVVDVAKRLGIQFRAQQRRQVRRHQGGRAPVGRVHPGRLLDHPAGAGQRVRDPRRRRQVLRADPGAGDPRPGGQEARRRQPALRAAGQHRGGPRRRGRRPLPGRRQLRDQQVRRQPHRGRRQAASSARRSPASPAPPTRRRPPPWSR